MNLWDRLKMIIRRANPNGWLESRDERLRRLEADAEVQQHETQGLKRYFLDHWQQGAQ